MIETYKSNCVSSYYEIVDLLIIRNFYFIYAFVYEILDTIYINY